MPLTVQPLPFGLRDVQLKPVVAGVAGSTVDLPIARTFSFSEVESFEELAGDDVVAASHGGGPTVDWSLEAGGISLEAYQVLAGGIVASSGTTPAQKKTYTKLTTDVRPYFQCEGQAISDSGGDVHCIVYRCKADGSLDGEFGQGAFWLTSCSGKGYGNLIASASPGLKLYDFIQNETAIAIT